MHFKYLFFEYKLIIFVGFLRYNLYYIIIILLNIIAKRL